MPFRKQFAKRDKIIETLFEDVRKMDKKCAKAFVADALALNAKAMLVIGGFPCKGLSHARGESSENLKNKDSILFYETTRILELVRQTAGRRIPVKHIIENVMMDKDPEHTISHHLAGRPTKIPAGPVCVASRDRCFELFFSIEPFQDETLTIGTRRNELAMVEDPLKCNFWDKGWGPTPSFMGHIPTFQG